MMAKTKEEKLARAREYDRARYAKDPTSKKASCKRYRDSNKGKRTITSVRLAAYGLSIEEYDTLLNRQGGKCAICHTTQPYKTVLRRFYVDHDHKTGKVRGLLCCACNSWLGRIQDDPEAGIRVTKYPLGELNGPTASD